MDPARSRLAASILAAAMMAAFSCAPASAKAPKKGSASEEEKGRAYLEAILEKLKAAQGVKIPVHLEYLPKSHGAWFDCATGRAEEGDSPAMASFCKGKGGGTGAIAAGTGIWDMGKNDDQLAFMLGHELGHIVHKDVAAQEIWSDVTFKWWMAERAKWVEDFCEANPEGCQKARGILRDKNLAFAGFTQDWLETDLKARPPDTTRLRRKDREIIKAVQDSWKHRVSAQEHAADEYGCKAMAAAGYKPSEASQAVMGAADLYVRIGETEDPSGHGSYADRAWELYEKALRHGCE